MLTSPNYIQLLLKRHGFKIKKSLGQNFLTDNNIINKIVEAADINKEDNVIEIGPGIGAMTNALAEKARQVWAIEIDQKLLPVLEETLSDHQNITVINEDALKVDFNQLIEQYKDSKFKVVANLPYYITTPLVMHLLEKKFKLSDIVVMVQKEVAERMVASPGGKDYGALSVAVQYYTKADIVFKVPPAVFLPRPAVDSAVVRMKVFDSPPVELKNEKLFFRVVKAAFGQRRKTLLNALKNAGLKDNKDELTEVLNKCGINPQCRGETLGLQEFACLSNNLN